MGKKSRRKRETPRVKADVALQKFQRLPMTVREDPWNETRINAFYSYVDMFHTANIAGCIKNPNNRFYREDDLQVLWTVGYSQFEPAISRVRALDLLGRMDIYTLDEFGKALERFEVALEVCETASSEDRKRNILIRGKTVNVGAWLKSKEEFLKEVVSGESKLLLSTTCAIR